MPSHSYNSYESEHILETHPFSVTGEHVISDCIAFPWKL